MNANYPEPKLLIQDKIVVSASNRLFPPFEIQKSEIYNQEDRLSDIESNKRSQIGFGR
jgi:hypothetical protein